MFKGFSKIEWRVISVSLVLMMVCAFLLSNEKALSWLGVGSTGGERGGRLRTTSGDVRVKPEDEAKWSKAKSAIWVGDNFYLGDGATADLELSSGAQISVTGKAIFRLIRLEGIPSFDMLAGKFVWKFSGPQAVAIKGARGVLSGKDSTLEIALDSAGLAEYQVKTIAGEGQLQLEKTSAAPDEAHAPKALANPNSNYLYIWRLEDFYAINDQIISPKNRSSPEVPLEVTLNWEHPSGGPFNVQISTTSDLTEERRFYSTVDPAVTLEKAFLGENFWRVAYANAAWSQVQKFTVEPRYLDAKIDPMAKDLKVNLRSQNEILLRWHFSSDMTSYIAEISRDDRFTRGQTEFKFLTSPEFVREFPKAEILFARMRGVNARQELTDWSPVARIVAR